MKIAFLSFYSGKVNRGMETVITQLSSRLAVNHQVKVITPNQNNNSKTILGFTLKALPTIHHFKPDIIFTANGGWQPLIIKIYTLFTRSKLIISGQAGLGRPDRWNLFLRPNLFVALTQKNALWAKKHSLGVNIVTIPNGVNLDQFKSKGSSLKLDLPQPIILCVAGPEKYKNVELTIQAVAKLKDISLLLAGGGESQQKLGENLLGKRFLRLQFTHDQMPEVYRSADVFTLVSESFEAFGVAYLEALASGLPIVAPDDQLRREILKNHAIYVKNPSNYDEYAKKLKEALNSTPPLAKDWLKKFTWDNIADQYIRAFQDVLKN